MSFIGPIVSLVTSAVLFFVNQAQQPGSSYVPASVVFTAPSPEPIPKLITEFIPEIKTKTDPETDVAFMSLDGKPGCIVSPATSNTDVSGPYAIDSYFSSDPDNCRPVGITNTGAHEANSEEGITQCKASLRSSPGKPKQL